MRIFVVEDSVVIRTHLVGLLSKLPRVSIVGEAESEDEAVASISCVLPDLVILDLALSPGSGFEVLKSIRAAGNTCQVLVVTNQTIDQYRRLSFALGANGFYDKNIDLESMLEKIKEDLLLQ